MHTRIFNVAITCISRLLILRDRLLGRIGPGRFGNTADAVATRHTIQSGENTLDAVYVTPVGREPDAVVLLCHGIGEVVERWFPVQQLLAANGGASLVFDYSGYGRSTGSISWTQCETDTVAAFEYLRGLAPGYPLSVLGFSLGSGVAAAAMDRIRPHMLVLCAAFTSFRAAAHSLGLPRKIAPVIPDIWKAAETLRECRIPVLVVHGERDALFPVRMAEELAKLCGPCAELLIVPRLGHNEPFYKPRMAYWGLILSRLAAQQKAAVSAARL